ncbi:hypothetical protein TZ00_02850 [Agreia bicolorata]|uniref:Polymerase/histidinol phosphatase N-terminal domain-containing protein n=1 Tax=Agreia bicolorata TaxID=110935 RepID=A0ABR5CJ92_9MICO|nr:hypothetical protein TZ00_02850 [Agreia bicolorata]
MASSFSVHHGTGGPAELVDLAAAAGAQSAAITDRDGLYGAVRHIRQCIDSAVNPIVGVELQVDDATTDARSSSITVLAHGRNDGAGWAGLSRLISAAHSPKRGRHVLSGTANRSAAIPAGRLPSFVFSDGRPVATVMLCADSDVDDYVTDMPHRRTDKPDRTARVRARALVSAYASAEVATAFATWQEALESFEYKLDVFAYTAQEAGPYSIDAREAEPLRDHEVSARKYLADLVNGQLVTDRRWRRLTK